MTEAELFLLKQQVNILQELLPRYGGKTIENVFSQIKARIQYNEAKPETMNNYGTGRKKRKGYSEYC